MIGQKIRMLRELRNYSQEFVASKLGISQNAYSRLELNQTKLSTAHAEKLAEVLEISITDLLSKDNPIITFSNNQLIEKGYIHSNYELQKEAIEKTIAAKDGEILSLKQEIEYLRKQNDQLLNLVGKNR